MLITARENNICMLGLKQLTESQTVDTLKKGDTLINGQAGSLAINQTVDIY